MNVVFFMMTGFLLGVGASHLAFEFRQAAWRDELHKAQIYATYIVAYLTPGDGLDVPSARRLAEMIAGMGETE